LIPLNIFSLKIKFVIVIYTAILGQITMGGLTIPVDGVEEKFKAARKAGIKTIIAPSTNQEAIEKIDAKYKKNIRIVYVEDFLTPSNFYSPKCANLCFLECTNFSIVQNIFNLKIKNMYVGEIINFSELRENVKIVYKHSIKILFP